MKTGMGRTAKNLLSWLLTLALVCSAGWPVTALSEAATDSSAPTETMQEVTPEPATPTPVPETPTPAPETPSPAPETTTPEPVTEALELGQPHVDRHLPTLERDGHVPARLGALGTAAGGLALRALAATQPGLGGLGPGRRLQVVQLDDAHLPTSSTSTR